MKPALNNKAQVHRGRNQLPSSANSQPSTPCRADASRRSPAKAEAAERRQINPVSRRSISSEAAQPRVAPEHPGGGGSTLPLLTRRELAAHLKISVRTIDRMVAAGEVPVHRIRNRIRFILAEVLSRLRH